MTENPWRTICEAPGGTTSVMSVPGGCLVLVQWNPRHDLAAQSMVFVPCAGDDKVKLKRGLFNA